MGVCAKTFKKPMRQQQIKGQWTAAINLDASQLLMVLRQIISLYLCPLSIEAAPRNTLISSSQNGIETSLSHEPRLRSSSACL